MTINVMPYVCPTLSFSIFNNYHGVLKTKCVQAISVELKASIVRKPPVVVNLLKKTMCVSSFFIKLKVSIDSNIALCHSTYNVCDKCCAIFTETHFKVT